MRTQGEVIVVYPLGKQKGGGLRDIKKKKKLFYTKKKVPTAIKLEGWGGVKGLNGTAIKKMRLPLG